MDNVNSLIGGQGTTFTNSFVNFSLCCPSRATFLTGQYAHNHGVLANAPPDGGFPRFDPHGDNNLAVWLQRAGYYTAMVGKYLNRYPNDPRSHAGWSEWYAAPIRATRMSTTTPSTRTGRLSVTESSGGLQTGRAHLEGGGLRQRPGPDAEAVLPLADLYGPPHRGAGPEPQPAVQLRRRGQACPPPCASLRARATAETSQLQRGGRLRQAGEIRISRS